MAQSLTGLPESADIDIANWWVSIRDHEIIDGDGGLFNMIIGIAGVEGFGRGMLYQLEKLGISYEAAIECCAHELEQNVGVLVDVIRWHIIRCGIEDMTGEEYVDLFLSFSKSEAGRNIAGQFVEKIRSCDNWDDLYDELNHMSKFYKDMRKKIGMELKQCRKI